MFSFQTLSCLHDIPVVRSSTNKLQDVYTKAKDTSALIRVPCCLAETVAGKVLKIALTVANPVVKPLCGPVHAIDNYAAQTIRQIESKYPVINTPTENVVDTFNVKTKPVLNVVNSVRDTTTSTIQHGKETVSNVATATVNKASGVVDSVFSFCETHAPRMQCCNAGKTNQLNEYICSTAGSLFNHVFQMVQPPLLWFRMLVASCLLKTKQTNDVLLTKMQQKRFLLVLPQRLLILVGSFLENVTRLIMPNDATMAEQAKPWQQTQQQNRFSSLSQYFFNRQNLKPNLSATGSKKVVINQRETSANRARNFNNISKPQPDYSNMADVEELHARLASNDLRESTYDMGNDMSTTEPVYCAPNDELTQLHDGFKPTDVKLLFSGLSPDGLPKIDDQEPLTEDQQQLHARIIGAGLEEQGYHVDDNDNDD
ncbi:unnamed protein product [Rotaria sp. Silwood2]|nr:unnamed protein product [Rotaria sp. Silwood2]CAF4132715.1 unnamed protein product [Rotaria sp. Silwood2]